MSAAERLQDDEATRRVVEIADVVRASRGRVEALGVGSWRAVSEPGTRADETLLCTSRRAREKAVQRLVAAGMRLLGTKDLPADGDEPGYPAGQFMAWLVWTDGGQREAPPEVRADAAQMGKPRTGGAPARRADPSAEGEGSSTGSDPRIGARSAAPVRGMDAVGSARARKAPRVTRTEAGSAQPPEPLAQMTGGSLFSGIEGLGLGLIWSGLITSLVWQVEIDPFCRRVLAARFPDVDRSVSDVHAASASTLRPVDLICFGSPCQDLSGAGQGEGLEGERSGLWFEGLRVVAELEPRVVLFENVASGARRWVCPVRGGLEALGYRTRALNIGVDDCGGPHRRKRIFILAYLPGAPVADADNRLLRPQSGRCSGQDGPNTAEPSWCGEPLADADRHWEPQPEGGVSDEPGRLDNGGQAMADANGEHSGSRGHGTAAVLGERPSAPVLPGGEDCRTYNLAHADGAGLPRADVHVQGGRGGAPERDGVQRTSGTEPPVGPRPDGLPAQVVRWPAPPGPQAAWEPPRVLADVPYRAAKLKAIGNAVSPIQACAVGEWALSILRADANLGVAASRRVA